MKKTAIFITLVFMISIAILSVFEKAEAARCGTYGHFFTNGRFVCDGLGNVICFYPCNGGGNQ